MRYSLPIGKTQLEFSIPSEFNVTTLTPNQGLPIGNVDTRMNDVLKHPINSPPLATLAKGKNSACIVVTDITRDSPDKEILPYILETLGTEIESKNITLLIACGMHRKMTYEEKIEKYGKNVVGSYRIIDHDGRDQKNLVNLGFTKNGTPIKISKTALDSDLLISLGVVEPHQFAGYSGGYKTVSIGVAGDETISHTHSAMMISHPKTKVSNVKDNPIYDDIVEIGKKSGLEFIVNVILGHNKEILFIEAGDPHDTHNSLIEKAKQLYEISIPKSYDVAICGVGFPRDKNLYQVSRAASYLFFAPKPVLKEGGYVIIPAQCDEGAGLGVGEQRFFSQLKNNTVREILETKEPFKAGEQRAFFMANVLEHNKVIIVNSKVPDIVQEAQMKVAKTMDDAFEMVQDDLGEKLDLLIMPNSLMTLPVIQSDRF